MNSAKRTKSDLRKFGLTVGLVLLAIAAVLYWREKPAAPILAVVSALLLFFGLILPKALRPVEFAWMKLAEVLAFISTRVILTFAFFAVILPFGIVIRLFRRDLLSLRLDRSAESYWIETEVDGPRSRPRKPY
ncbi:MAG: hypothetical protein HKN13_15290 [Rhodothermales bacterium]|nr:hypothetical protein [Rhodothermales bacterium]